MIVLQYTIWSHRLTVNVCRETQMFLTFLQLCEKYHLDAEVCLCVYKSMNKKNCRINIEIQLIFLSLQVQTLNSIKDRFESATLPNVTSSAPLMAASALVLPLNVALLGPLVQLASSQQFEKMALTAPECTAGDFCSSDLGEQLTDRPCKYPVAPYPEFNETTARTLWVQTKKWVDQYVANLLPEVCMKNLKISQHDFDQWYHGNDDWQNQPEKSMATTVMMRRKIMWLDTRKYVNLVREIDAHTYYTHLRMDKKVLDSWYTGELPSDVTTDFLRSRCYQLSINGIIWMDTTRLVRIFHVQYPNTFLQDLKTDQATLDTWMSGANSTFHLTNEFRRNVLTATKRLGKLSAVPLPPS